MESDPKASGLKGIGQLKIISPNGDEVGLANIEIDLIDHHRFRTRARMSGLPIPKNESGYFYFVIELKVNNAWNEVARIPLEITLNTISIDQNNL